MQYENPYCNNKLTAAIKDQKSYMQLLQLLIYLSIMSFDKTLSMRIPQFSLQTLKVSLAMEHAPQKDIETIKLLHSIHSKFLVNSEIVQ